MLCRKNSFKGIFIFSQFTPIYQPKNLKNAATQGFSQLRHLTIPTILFWLGCSVHVICKSLLKDVSNIPTCCMCPNLWRFAWNLSVLTKQEFKINDLDYIPCWLTFSSKFFMSKGLSTSIHSLLHMAIPPTILNYYPPILRELSSVS